MLALGVLVLNPAHFPFFVAVAQELSLGSVAATAAAAAVAAAAAEEEDQDSDDSEADEEDARDAAGWDEGMRPGYDVNGNRRGGCGASSPRDINAAGGGDLLASSLSSHPVDVPKGGPSLWGLPSPRLSSSVNSGGRSLGEWVGVQVPAHRQQLLQQQEKRMSINGGDSAGGIGSVPRGLVRGKLLAESQGAYPRGQNKQQRQRRRRRRRRRHKEGQEQPHLSEGLLQALGGEAAQQYAVLWRVLEKVRDVDPFAHVAEAAGAVIAVVMEQAEAFAAVRRAARAAEEDEDEVLALAGTTPVSSSSSADTRVLSWSSSSFSAPGSGASANGGRGNRPGDAGAGAGGGLSGSPWAASLQAVPPATSDLDQPHLLHAFYKWSCREFSEPVRPAPAQVVPDVARLAAPVKPERRLVDGFLPGVVATHGGVAAAAAVERPGAAREEAAGGSGIQTERTLWQKQQDDLSAQQQKKLRIQQQQQQQQLLRQQHRHDPVDSLSFEGSLHLYLKDRNLRAHDGADVSIAEWTTQQTGPVRSTAGYVKAVKISWAQTGVVLTKCPVSGSE